VEEKKIPRPSPLAETPPFLKRESTIEYKIGEKSFLLKTDFTFSELEWLDVVFERIAPSIFSDPGSETSGEEHEIRGSFTRDEIEKTLKILLVPTTPQSPPSEACLAGRQGGEEKGWFTHEDFLKTRESQAVKVIADFFLMKAVLGYFIKSSLVN
jgi:hypothetical protein